MLGWAGDLCWEIIPNTTALPSLTKADWLHGFVLLMPCSDPTNYMSLQKLEFIRAGKVFSSLGLSGFNGLVPMVTLDSGFQQIGVELLWPACLRVQCAAHSEMLFSLQSCCLLEVFCFSCCSGCTSETAVHGVLGRVWHWQLRWNRSHVVGWLSGCMDGWVERCSRRSGRCVFIISFKCNIF